MFNITRWITVLTLIAVVGISLAYAVPASAGGGATATVTSYGLNVRSGPGPSYSRITAVTGGTVLTMYARNPNSDWVRVQIPDGRVGWVSVYFIAPSIPIVNLPIEYTPNIPPVPQPPQATATVTSYGLNVRTGPGAQYPRLLAIPRGTVVTLLARNVDMSWVRVRLGSGQEGWVNTGYIAANVALSSLPIAGTTPPPQPQPSPGYIVHTVQAGENLFRIALRYGVDLYYLAQVNGIANIRLIYAGQQLLIPQN